MKRRTFIGGLLGLIGAIAVPWRKAEVENIEFDGGDATGVDFLWSPADQSDRKASSGFAFSHSLLGNAEINNIYGLDENGRYVVVGRDEA